MSNKLQFAILRKQSYELRVTLYELQSNFACCIFILPVGNKIMSCKFFLRAASCFLQASYKFQKLFFELQVVFQELKITNFILTVL